MQTALMQPTSSVPSSSTAPLVLWIDDDPDVATPFEARLRSSNVRLATALHGSQGIWKAVTEKPDVIVLDLSMPHCNGMHVMEILARNAATSEIPVVIVSGRADNALGAKLLRMGASKFLHKPLEWAELRDALAEHMEIGESSESSFMEPSFAESCGEGRACDSWE